MKKLKPVFVLFLSALIFMAGCDGNGGENSSSVQSSQGAQTLAEKYKNSYTDGEFPTPTPAAQAIIDKYFASYSVTNFFRMQFDSSVLEGYDAQTLLAMFDALCYNTQTEEFTNNLTQLEGQVPQQYVEDVLTAYFALTPEDIRQICAQQYNAETQSYTCYFGLGGGPTMFIIDKTEQNGNVLTIDYIIYGPNPGESDEILFSPYLMGTLKVRESGEDFTFLANTSTELADKLPN